MTSGESPCCVVVADDDGDWRKLMANALRSAGYCVDEAADGDELVAHCCELRARAFRVLVVSDVDMPGCTGLEATARLRALGANATVLLVTGTHSARVVAAAQNAGAYGVMRKPISKRDLLATVGHMMRGQKS